MSVRFLSDEQLLRECRWDVYRGSGPGGQKRNKTSNTVRLTHVPTSIAVTATESRSLSENKMRAVRRLRLRLCAEIREPVDLARFSPPDWFLEIRRHGRIEVSHRNPLYAPTAGLVLDLLYVLRGNPAPVAVMLGVPTTGVIRLLEDDTHLWTAATRIRTAEQLPPLSHRR